MTRMLAVVRLLLLPETGQTMVKDTPHNLAKLALPNSMKIGFAWGFLLLGWKNKAMAEVLFNWFLHYL